MGCHAPGEDVDDDYRAFLMAAQEDATLAAQEDATLAAHLLIRLSRSEMYAPWRQFREPESPLAGSADELPLSDPPKWGKRRARSRCLTMETILAAKREEAGRSSPTTPLSWSGGSWTSGSVCGSTPPRPPKRQKQPDSAPRRDVEPPPSPPAKRPKPEPQEHTVHGPAPTSKSRKRETAYNRDGAPHGVVAAGAAAGSASGPGSTKAVVAGAAGGPPRAVAHAEASRPRWTGEGTNSVGVRRPRKKKTVPELKALEESLLQEEVELRKDLEEQKKTFEALLEENIRLKNLEASLASQRAGEPPVTPAAREEAGSEDPQQPPTVKGPSTAADLPERLSCTSPPTSVPQRAPLFDLNCPPDDDALF